ncbi:hypothetical protein CI610_02904 [invertebrate metagenome]|uniref:Uncharacterized protein n=1 Tax=invertebrate metagenome TaxID=1711999 RepID=A0A2H9T4L1_9ZZZZ
MGLLYVVQSGSHQLLQGDPASDLKMLLIFQNLGKLVYTATLQEV